MTTTKNAFGWDAAERVAWSTAELSAGLLVADLAGLDAWWAAPLGAALAGIKVLAAQHVGHAATASTLPTGKDPAALRP